MIPGFSDPPEQADTEDMGPPIPAHTPLPPAPDPDTTSTEPLLSVGGLTAVVTVLLALLTLFGLRISSDVKETILTAVGVLAPIVVAVVGRSKVWSGVSVNRLLADALTRKRMVR